MAAAALYMRSTACAQRCTQSVAASPVSYTHLDVYKRQAENFGAQVPTGINIDFPAAMERLRRIRARLSRFRGSAQRLSSIGVDVYLGEARFAGPKAVVVDGKILRFRKALIATGARPNSCLLYTSRCV